MSVLVSLLVFVIVVGLVIWLLDFLPLPAPFGMIARVVVVVLALIWLIQDFGLLGFGHRL